MDFEKLHYPITVSNGADYVICEGKKYEVVRKNDASIRENLIDENDYNATIRGSNLYLSLPHTYYNTNHKIAIKDIDTDEVISNIEKSSFEEKLILSQVIPEAFKNKDLKLRIKVKKSIFNIIATFMNEFSKWETAYTFPSFTNNYQLAIKGDIIYIQYNKDMYSLNIKTLEYKKLSTISSASSYALMGNMDIVENIIYSYESSKYIRKFSIDENKYTSISSPIGHTGSSVVIDNNIVMIGGTNHSSDGSLSDTNKITVYDPVTNATTSKNVAPFRGVSSSCFNDNLIYCIGVYNQNNKLYTPKNHIYDTITDTWSLGTEYPFAVTENSVISVNGFIYSFGGKTGHSINTSKSESFKYDTSLKTWTNSVEQTKAMSRNSIFLYENKVYIAGGRDSTNEINKNLEYLE